MRRKLVPFLFFVLTTDGFSQALGTNSFVGGGLQNTVTATSTNGFIGAGARNTNEANNGGIVAGADNSIKTEARRAFIGAGGGNLIERGATNSVIGGGSSNKINTNSCGSVIGGGDSNFVYIYGSNSVIGGGSANAALNGWSVIGGGRSNASIGYYSFLGGGRSNTVVGTGAVGCGGGQNDVAGDYAFLGGGQSNVISTIGPYPEFAVLSGGYKNSTDGSLSVISGGFSNLITSNGSSAVISGGAENQALGQYATVAGGLGSWAGTRSFAAGVRVRATNAGSFVWSGQDGPSTVSTNDNSFTVRCQGGARFLTTSAQTPAALVGVQLAGGATAWAVLSDSNAKTDFQPIRQREVLSKVASLPVRAWEYKHDPGRRYLGPTSQDFRASFGLGDDTSINTLDADGVLFASVQGLVQELEERDRAAAWRELQHASALAERDGEIEGLKKDIRELKDRIDSMLPPSTVKK